MSERHAAREKLMIDSPIQRTNGRGRTASMLIATFLLFGGTDGFAQVVQPSADALAELDRRVQAHLAENNIPGGLVAVASRGRLIHLETYGMANVELAVPVTDKAPLSVIAPVVFTVSAPPRVEAPRPIAFASVICTAPVPEFRLTAPVKLFDALSKVSAFVPLTVKLDVPPIVRAPLSPSCPAVLVAVRFPVVLKALVPRIITLAVWTSTRLPAPPVVML